jgi:flagellin
MSISALKLQRALQQSSQALGTVFERLASGQRINRASDDAAGLSIADSLGAQRRVLGQAIRNISDGFSALAIADGTLDQQSRILDRLTELASQSLNGTYSAVQVAALDTEYQQLTREFGRQGDVSRFNGIDLLRLGRTGSGEFDLQIGTTGGVGSALRTQLSDSGSFSGVVTVRSDLAYDDGTPLYGTGETNNGVDSGDYNYFFGALFSPGSIDDIDNITNGQSFRHQVRQANGTLATYVIGFASDFTQLDNSVLMVAWRDNGDGTFTYMDAAASSVDLSTGEVAESQIRLNLGAGAGFSIDTRGLQIFFQDGTYDSGGLDGNPNAQPSAIQFTNLNSSVARAQALEALEARRAIIGAQRGQIGALQSRLESVSRLSEDSRVVTAQAESRIRDVDIAGESARMVQLSILQESTARLLASVGNIDNLALTLLRA